MAGSLTKKRWRAVLQIAAYSGANIVFAGTPKPGAEIPTQIALTGTDFVMCATIFYEYYNEQISQERILEILGAGGLIVAIAGGGGYAIAGGASGLIAEVTNWLGPVGWAASGLLAARGTALLGLIWLAIIDRAYSSGVGLEEAARAQATT
jgi:hypothetical protein